MTTSRFRNLLVQIDPKLWEAVDEAAKMAGLTKKQLIEGMLAAAAGRPHAHIQTQRNVWARYRRAILERKRTS